MGDRSLPSVRSLTFGTIATLALCCSLAPRPAAAQQLTRGFDQIAPAQAFGEELNRQRDLWVMEVQFKPMRMVVVNITDPKTGETAPEQIWYLAYRTVNRPVTVRVADDTEPVNTLDPLPGPRMFLPKFTLITYDDPNTEIPSQITVDEVLPEAVEAIRRIERAPLQDSVSVVQNLPEPVPHDQVEVPWVYGIATWRGIDPETDFFKIVLHGFSNGYETRGDQTWRKVLVQRFSRPGDRFDPNQTEFFFTGKPQWTYLPTGPATTASTIGQ